MEESGFAPDPEEVLPWSSDDQAFDNLFEGFHFDFDNLESPKFDWFSAGHNEQETQQCRELHVTEHTAAQTIPAYDVSPLDSWAPGDHGLHQPISSSPDLSTIEDIISDGSTTWTPSDGSSFIYSSVGSQTTTTSPVFLTESLILSEPFQDLRLRNMAQPLGSQSSKTTSQGNRSIMPKAPKRSPAPSIGRTRRRQRRTPQAMPAREQRILEKPVKCPICGHGHAYKADLKKHIRSNHPERAAEFGLTITRSACESCSATFARQDHLLRHRRNKHGWQ